MAVQKNVLLVTDYRGTYHIRPIGNRANYESKNKSIKKLQYKMQEMSRAEAQEIVEKNNGRDPEHITPGKAVNIISEKDKQIEDLQRQLAELQATPPKQGPGRPKTVEVPEPVQTN